MAWTRAHFDAVADVLATQRAAIDTDADIYAFEHNAAKIGALNSTAYQFANMFHAANPRFDRPRFLRACGID